MNTLDVVVGGQFGSESKGRVTADLAQRAAQQAAVIGVRVAGPNAGHVVIDEQGCRWPLRQIPVAMVSDPMSTGVIAAGSEIDLQVLEQEITDLEDAGIGIRHRLLIDAQATMLQHRHHEAEGGNDGPLQNRIGSTGKGIGAARADRIWRTAQTAGDAVNARLLGQLGHVTDTQAYLQAALADKRGRNAVIIEGTQGYGLGLHAGYYPHCTSSDCRAIDFMAMAGVSPWGVRGGVGGGVRVWVVLRAYPIRVAGNSGPLKDETSWEELGLARERTTVTQKVRRVGQWDPELARRAVLANGGGRGGSDTVQIALAMADQRFPALAGITQWSDVPFPDGTRQAVHDWVMGIEAQTGARVGSIGTGPTSTIWLGAGADADRYRLGPVQA